MKSQLIYKSILAVAIFLVVSCKPEFKTITPSKGQADFTRYIAVGNSLTSGFADGGLYLEGQQNSFPDMIATQMKSVGGGTFYTPFFDAGQADGSGYKKLTSLVDGNPVLTDVAPQAVRGQVNVPGYGNVTLFTKYTGEINNYGVPGIRLSLSTYAPYGNLNPYFERMLPGSAPMNNTSYLDFVTAKPFTFFSMWLGNNDVLGYATSGAASAADAPTDKATFTFLYNQVVSGLLKGGTGVTGAAKGVVATVPDVLSTPFFKTVTLASLLKAVQVSAPQVNALYIRTGSGAVRAATDQDYFLLTLGSANVIGVPTGGVPYGLAPQNPIESKWVLDMDEAAVITDYTNAYNATIRAAAAANDLALVDAYALLKEYSTPRGVSGITVSTAFITGNLFSLDGIHLTPLGYAIIANEFIKAINAKYGSSIPGVDVSKYRGVKIP